ncbi:DUF4426 domain-containing protein [Thalassolituus sp. LLYu03]|uniref:DUF4426 domain-containing protein n=1 Tax=Thalassolituus sp. LLYu03 TaxID=3421656 RepID=UPI003D2BBFF2
MKKVLMTLFALFTAVALPAYADRGEQKQVFGDYEVHYIGLNSSFLSPDVAEAYGITRSRSLGFLNISILKKTGQPDVLMSTTGKVTGTMKNLIGQKKEFEFKEIKESDAVYYISTFRFDELDIYKIELKVTPDGQSRTFDVKFDQRFYED